MSKYVGFKIGKVHESSHIISEYYCGGCGWPVTDHDSFCPECGGAFRECDADNFEEENAKLRELISSVLVLRHDPTYEWLDIALAEICGKGFTEQARELGIEVG